MDRFHKLYHAVKRRHTQMEITVGWVPGHEGIEGNEAADEEAKNAATRGSSPASQLPAVLRKKLPKSATPMRKSFTKFQPHKGYHVSEIATTLSLHLHHQRQGNKGRAQVQGHDNGLSQTTHQHPCTPTHQPQLPIQTSSLNRKDG
ncbi:hypothetical protein BDP27DRAFT_1225915 [Rhodocollybia butyracea]|uniref:RNase H type-1 domain-containing protein n=1 Tax=Rhodocollybia butyracea TaxID=206335 RepID=A0A9P5U627_9AGAR|nr:hypothetical protein BDP27DRAFT_1225915 [Rhodocollybia butyracea]